MDIPGVIGLALGVVSLATIIWKLGFEWSTLKSDARIARESAERVEISLKEHIEECKELASKVSDSSTKVGLFWDLVRQQLPHMLTISRSQNLLERLRDDNITDDELLKLEVEIREKIPSSTQNKALILTRILALWAVAVKKGEREL